MKRIGLYLLGIILCLSSLLQFHNVLVGLEPLHLLHSHRALSVSALFSEDLPESDYLRIEEGYVIPGYSVSGSRMTLGHSVYLVTEAGQAYWLENRTEGQLDGKPKENLFITLDEDQFSQIWPEVGDDLSDIHPFSLPPVQMDVVGRMETLTPYFPPNTGSENSDIYYLRLEKVFAPWWLLFALIVGGFTLNGAYRCFTFGRSKSQVEEDDTSIGTAEVAN